MQPEDQHLT